jgi:sugar O-acyltransferase (sialic acid O-acetyltransferase NeuD family)
MKSIAIFGAGGHTKVIIDLLQLLQYNIVGIYDDYKTGKIMDIPILNTTDNIDTTFDEYIIGIGDSKIRKKLYQKYNLPWAVLIHPTSTVSKYATIGKGTVIFAGSVIQTDVTIGKQCIINTNCNIDHESIIQDFCSICPGVTICGKVFVHANSFIGANSTIIPTIEIGENCIIGAGAVVIQNVENHKKVVGNPAKII